MHVSKKCTTFAPGTSFRFRKEWLPPRMVFIHHTTDFPPRMVLIHPPHHGFSASDDSIHPHTTVFPPRMIVFIHHTTDFPPRMIVFIHTPFRIRLSPTVARQCPDGRPTAERKSNACKPPVDRQLSIIHARFLKNQEKNDIKIIVNHKI